MIDNIKRIMAIQKNATNATRGASSIEIGSAFFSGVGATGIIESMKTDVMKEIVNKGIQAMPCHVGPNGRTHNWPDHVIRKIARNMNHKVFNRLRVYNAMSNTIAKATKKTAGTW
jgi:hypothetical protein